MSHEFLITDAIGSHDKKDPYKALRHMQAGRYAAFHGYGDGALYEAFSGEEFNGGVSGNFGGRIITSQQAKEGLRRAISLLATYPDPRRVDGLKRYLLEVVEPSQESSRFYIHYY